MRQLLVLLSAAATLAAAPSVASAATTVMVFDGDVTVLGSGAAMDIVADAPAADTVTITNHAPGDTISAGAGCTKASETVTCAALPAGYSVQLYGSELGDSIEAAETTTVGFWLYGRGGNDVLIGGGGPDRFTGGYGDDEVDGRGGSDHVDNGLNDSNGYVADDDADVYRDTGTSGDDTINFGFQTAAVHIKVDGSANDGSSGGGEGDDVRSGFERLRGTIYGDTIDGGAGAEVINGSQGDDTISGGGGADTIEGNEGVDNVNARDGGADLVIDCDSASSVTQGSGETALIDANDPEPLRCETVDRLGGGPGPTPTPTPGPGDPTPTPTPGGDPGAAVPAPLALGPVNVTETVSRMPRVTGKKFTAARDEVLKVVAFAQVEIEFKRGCSKGDFLEVTKQTPITNASLSTDVRDPAPVTLVACIAEADYLRDCDMAGIKADIKKLGNKALDADVALTVLTSVNRCKVDYDVKISKQAEEARIKLEAQRASEALEKTARDKANAKKQAQDKIKANLRASITCPIGGPLRVGVIDGYTPRKTALGLKKAAFAGDPDAWSLPSHPAKDYESFLEIVVSDRSAQFPEAKVFLDTDDVTDADTVGSKASKLTVGGHAVFQVRPQKRGTIKVCAVVETGGDEVVSTGLEIPVTGQPKSGTLWETQSGRLLKITGDGPVAQKSALAARVSDPQGTRANVVTDFFQTLADMFSGASRAIGAALSGGGESRVRLAAVAEKARAGVGQIALAGKLTSDPQPASLDPNGKCLQATATGELRQVSPCPVLRAPPRGGVLVGMSNDGTGVLAFGHGNVLKAGPGGIVKNGQGQLIGLDGSTLIGNDGSTLIGNDGSTLIGNDGSTLIGNDGSTLIGNDGSTLIGNDGSTLLGAVGATALMPAPAQVIARDGASMMPSAAGLVAAGGLN